MSDIVERLRVVGVACELLPGWDADGANVCVDAADEIVRLRNWQAAAAAWIRTDVEFSPDILHDGVMLEHAYLLLSQVDDTSSPSVPSIPDAFPRASGRSAAASPGGGGAGGVSVTSADVPKPAPHSMWNGARL